MSSYIAVVESRKCGTKSVREYDGEYENKHAYKRDLEGNGFIVRNIYTRQEWKSGLR